MLNKIEKEEERAALKRQTDSQSKLKTITITRQFRQKGVPL